MDFQQLLSLSSSFDRDTFSNVTKHNSTLGNSGLLDPSLRLDGSYLLELAKAREVKVEEKKNEQLEGADLGNLTTNLENLLKSLHQEKVRLGELFDDDDETEHRFEDNVLQVTNKIQTDMMHFTSKHDSEIALETAEEKEMLKRDQSMKEAGRSEVRNKNSLAYQILIDNDTTNSDEVVGSRATFESQFQRQPVTFIPGGIDNTLFQRQNDMNNLDSDFLIAGQLMQETRNLKYSLASKYQHLRRLHRSVLQEEAALTQDNSMDISEGDSDYVDSDVEEARLEKLVGHLHTKGIDVIVKNIGSTLEESMQSLQKRLDILNPPIPEQPPKVKPRRLYVPDKDVPDKAIFDTQQAAAMLHHSSFESKEAGNNEPLILSKSETANIDNKKLPLPKSRLVSEDSSLNNKHVHQELDKLDGILGVDVVSYLPPKSFGKSILGNSDVRGVLGMRFEAVVGCESTLRVPEKIFSNVRMPCSNSNSMEHRSQSLTANAAMYLQSDSDFPVKQTIPTPTPLPSSTSSKTTTSTATSCAPPSNALAGFVPPSKDSTLQERQEYLKKFQAIRTKLAKR